MTEKKKSTKEAKETKEVKEKKTSTKDVYFEGVGRRKTAVARVRLFEKGTGFVINDKKMEEHFPTKEMQKIATEALAKMKGADKFKISVKVKGSGIHSQAEAVRHGISRALIKLDVKSRGDLKKAGFLTRDSRAKERYKFGLRKARKAVQWRKR